MYAMRLSRSKFKLALATRMHCRTSQRRHQKNGKNDLKRLNAVLEAGVYQQAKLMTELNLAENYSPGEVKPTMDKLREGNRRLAKFNGWAKIYIETKLADPAWDAANIGK